MYKVAFDKEGKLQQGKEDMQLRRKSGKKKAIDPRVARAKLVLQAIERSDMESIAVSCEPVSVSLLLRNLGGLRCLVSVCPSLPTGASFAQLGQLEQPWPPRLLHVTSRHEEHNLTASRPCRQCHSF